MMHKLSETYGSTLEQSGKYTELDYWRMTGFKNLDIMKKNEAYEKTK